MFFTSFDKFLKYVFFFFSSFERYVGTTIVTTNEKKAKRVNKALETVDQQLFALDNQVRRWGRLDIENITEVLEKINKTGKSINYYLVNLILYYRIFLFGIIINNICSRTNHFLCKKTCKSMF